MISQRPLDLGSARKLLYGMLLGWTEPFIELCYVLAGGLPRDLWRVAHELVAQRNADDEIDLEQAAPALCRSEGEARLLAVRHELTRDPLDPESAELLRLISDINFTTATATDMLRWHTDMRNWATLLPVTVLGPDPASAAANGAVLTDEPPGTTTASRTSRARRLALETAAYLLFAASVLQFFVPQLIAERLTSIEADAKQSRALAALASARQSLALSPATSLALTEQFRIACDL